jgi:putative N6-adenine-specific DNA methylase
MRGYRLATAKAPLRETLAAAVVLGSGWDRMSPLVDPMCGAGTIPIEAALLARAMAPGRGRHFAFEQWPDHDARLWGEIRAQAEEQVLLRSAGPIQGSDRDAGAITASESNAARAGVAGDVVFHQAAMSALEPPAGTGWVVTNPPYGVRVGEADKLRDLFARFGQVLRARCAGWQVAMLSGNRALEAQLGLALEDRFRTSNGGIPVRLVTGGVPT